LKENSYKKEASPCMAFRRKFMALVVDIKWVKKKGEFSFFFNNTKGKIKRNFMVLVSNEFPLYIYIYI
jgi:hypothetical protein